MKRRRGRDERGAATVLTLALLGAVVAAAVLLAPLAGALVASRRAAAAADLAALAGAAALQHGRDGCAAASAVAIANQAELTRCTVDADDLLVGVAVDPVRLLGRSFRVSARARAGPSQPLVVASSVLGALLAA